MGMSHLFSLPGPAINLSLLQTLTFGVFSLTVGQAHKSTCGNTEVNDAITLHHLCRMARSGLHVYDGSETKEWSWSTDNATAVDGMEAACAINNLFRQKS